MQLMLCGINNHLKKWKSIILSKYEEINIAGGLKNVWELLGFLFQCEYNGFEANNFAPSVMPYK